MKVRCEVQLLSVNIKVSLRSNAILYWVLLQSSVFLWALLSRTFISVSVSFLSGILAEKKAFLNIVQTGFQFHIFAQIFKTRFFDTHVSCWNGKVTTAYEYLRRWSPSLTLEAGTFPGCQKQCFLAHSGNRRGLRVRPSQASLGNAAEARKGKWA